MTNAERVFEGGRRLSVVISLLLVIGCLVQVGFSAKEVWDEHQAKVLLREDFWKFAEKQTDELASIIFLFVEARGKSGELDELAHHRPKDLETDISELRQRSWKSFADEATGPLEVAIGGVLVIFAIRKALGWVVRGFLG